MSLNAVFVLAAVFHSQIAEAAKTNKRRLCKMKKKTGNTKKNLKLQKTQYIEMVKKQVKEAKK